MKTTFKKGQIPWNKGLRKTQVAWNKGIKGKESHSFGIKFTPERKKNISTGLTGIKRPYTTLRNLTNNPSKQGSQSHHWITDRTQLKRYTGSQERRSPAYYFWRQQVWGRDDFRCKIASHDCNGRIEAHHILSWRDYPELRYNSNNGITLCHAHHPRERAEEKRLVPEIQTLVSVSKDSL